MLRAVSAFVAQALTTAQAAVLGLVQGLTEFIPISSSGHLVLVPFLLRWPLPDLAFDVAVHLGTAVGVVAYFARDLWSIATGTVRTALRRGSPEDRGNARLLVLLAVGSIPAAITGLLVEGLFEDLFTRTEAVDRVGAPLTAVFLLGTAALLLGAEALYGRRDASARREIRGVRMTDALVIGAFQALAIAPGISRSGATISAGIFRGLRREAAARFSFLLSLPAILGAGLVALRELPPGAELVPMLTGALTAAVAGFAAIAFLLRYLRTRTMRPFAYYCAVLAVVALAFWSQIR